MSRFEQHRLRCSTCGDGGFLLCDRGTKLMVDDTDALVRTSKPRKTRPNN